jgi:transposase
MMAQFVSVWRKRGHSSRPARPRRIAPKQAAILTTKSPDQLTDEQRSLFDRLSASCRDLPWMRTLALDFRDALASKDRQQMLWWIQNAKRCGIGSLVRFAFGLQKDLSAVLAAVETPSSNGQVEGQINRLKTIKRQMYGGAGFDLLRAGVLPYVPPRPFTAQRATMSCTKRSPRHA